MKYQGMPIPGAILAIGAVLLLTSQAGASEILLENLVVGLGARLRSPPQAIDQIELPTGIDFHLIHVSGTTAPYPRIPDAVLFDNLVLTEDSVGQVFRRQLGDSDFDAFVALLTDGLPGFVGEFSHVIFASGKDTGSGASASGECDFLYPGKLDCQGPEGYSPDYSGIAIFNAVELTIDSVDLGYAEETFFQCDSANNCGYVTANGYRADYRGVLRWYGSAIPEPATGLSLGAGLACIGIVRRRRARAISLADRELATAVHRGLTSHSHPS